MLDRIGFFTKTWVILASIALLVGTAFLWYRGYWTADAISLSCCSRHLEVRSQYGRFWLCVTRQYGRDEPVIHWVSWCLADDWGCVPDPRDLEPDYRVFRKFGGRFVGWYPDIQVPASVMTLTFSMPLVVAGFGYYRRRRNRKHASALQPAAAA
jgi:hypothetical protein